MPQFVDHTIGSLRFIGSGIEDCFDVVEYEEYRLGRKIRSQRIQILRLDTRTDNLRKSVEEAGARHLEFVTAHEPPFIAELLFGPFMVEDCQGQGRFSCAAGANEGDGRVVVHERDDLFDELVPSEKQPWCLGRRFTDTSVV